MGRVHVGKWTRKSLFLRVCEASSSQVPDPGVWMCSRFVLEKAGRRDCLNHALHVQMRMH